MDFCEGKLKPHSKLSSASRIGLGGRRLEAERAAFIATLEASEAEAARDGSLSLDDMMQDMDRRIEDADRRRG